MYTDITQACYKHTLVHTNRLACTYTLTDTHVHKPSCWHSTQIYRHKLSQLVALPTHRDILIRHIQGRVRCKKRLFRSRWLLTWKSFQQLPQSLGSSGPRVSHGLCMYVRKGFEGQLYDHGQALALSGPQLPHLETEVVIIHSSPPVQSDRED